MSRQQWNDGSRSYRGGNRGSYRGGGGSYRGKSRGSNRGGSSNYNSGRRGRSQGGGGYDRGRDNTRADPRSRLEDDDIDMDGADTLGSSGRNRFKPYGSRPNRQGDRGDGPGRRLAMDGTSTSARERLGSSRHAGGTPYSHTSTSGWYMVTIPHGKKQDKAWLLQQLTDRTSAPFIPVQYHVERNNAVFYVNDKQAADALRQLSRQITDSQDFKILILTKPCGPPPAQASLDADKLEKLKLCMSGRYDPTAKSLNLKNLYNDPDLKTQGIQLALSRPNIMKAVIKIILENIAELQSLDLSDNRLYNLGELESMASQVPNLTQLNLENNQLKNENHLHPVQQMKLEDLRLDGNPLCDMFPDEKSYISAIRKRFPKVMKLDGHMLKAPIKFAIEDNNTLPATKGSCFRNEEVQSLVCKFLEQYYEYFDSDDRQPLLNAYHDNAVFSHSVCYKSTVTSKQANFADYLPDSRNLKRVHDKARRDKALRVGRLNVVALISSLPFTKHDLASFVVDVTLISPRLLGFAVHGLFKERGKLSNSGPIRAFSRTFLAVPQGGGIAIVNEQLSVTNASHDQQQNAFKTPAPTPSSSPVLHPATAGVVTPTPTPAAGAAAAASNPASPVMPPDNQKVQIVQQFAAQSGMNLEWSEKCLAQNNWDYNKSAQVFTNLHQAGKIPPEAFVK